MFLTFLFGAEDAVLAALAVIVASRLLLSESTRESIVRLAHSFISHLS